MCVFEHDTRHVAEQLALGNTPNSSGEHCDAPPPRLAVRGWVYLVLTTAKRPALFLLLVAEADDAREHAEAERHAREDHVEEGVVAIAIAIPLLAVDARAHTKGGS